MREIIRFLLNLLDSIRDRGRGGIALKELMIHHERLKIHNERLKEQYQFLSTECEKLKRSGSDLSVSFDSVLQRLRQRGVKAPTVIDVGASDGRWSQQLTTLLPDLQYLLLECNEKQRAKLQEFSARRPGLHLVIAAASDAEKTVYLSAETPDSGIVTNEPGRKRHQAVQATTVIEMYNFTLGVGHPARFPSMCQHLETLGFRPLYLSDPLHRPSDQALFQFDLIFARQDSPEYQFEGWR